MTWDEALELAKRLTRNEDGIQYRGLLVGGNLEVIGWGLGLSKVDPKTNKATMNTDGWLQALNIFKNVYSIPGNDKIEGNGQSLTKGDVAMNANFGAAQGEMDARIALSKAEEEANQQIKDNIVFQK